MWVLMRQSRISKLKTNTKHKTKHTQENGFPGGSDSKESACNVGDVGSIPGLGRSYGEGNGYLF